MNVALINKNPTVSRLITLSLNKLGADYIEIDEAGKLDGNFDYGARSARQRKAGICRRGT